MTKSFKAEVISLGRITIPKDIREELDIKDGDYVHVEGLTKLVLMQGQNPKEAT